MLSQPEKPRLRNRTWYGHGRGRRGGSHGTGATFLQEGTYKDYLGLSGLNRLGKKKWREEVADCAGGLVSVLHLDDVVLGGGNVKKLKTLPNDCAPGTMPMHSWEASDCGRMHRGGRPRGICARPGQIVGDRNDDSLIA